MITRITAQPELAALAGRLGVRPDWHEPGEQGVTARVLGVRFGNAGHWGQAAQERPQERRHRPRGPLETFVRISQDGEPVADVNLATLLAWAAQGTP